MQEQNKNYKKKYHVFTFKKTFNGRNATRELSYDKQKITLSLMTIKIYKWLEEIMSKLEVRGLLHQEPIY